MRLTDKARENVVAHVKKERLERYLQSFLSENRKAHTMKIEEESPQFLKYRLEDLISKKGWQNRVTALENTDSIILVNRKKGRLT